MMRTSRNRRVPLLSSSSWVQLPLFVLMLMLILFTTTASTLIADAFVIDSTTSATTDFNRRRQQQQRHHRRQRRYSSSSISSNNGSSHVVSTFDDAVRSRYACTRYKRYEDGAAVASPGDPNIVKLAREALELSTRAPTGFNAQPYKLLLVESPSGKEALAKYCIGRNRDRVLDSDCSVVFLADRQAMRSWKEYKSMLEESDSSSGRNNKSKTKLNWLKLRTLVALFSSGLPLPKLVAGPISFFTRFAMRVVSWFARSKLLVPTLSSPECWSQKNTMLVAMTYLLGCSARGLATTPMEGYLSWGIRQSLNIPRRYTIPLIVSTGRPYEKIKEEEDGKDDTGITHGNTFETATPRFPSDTVIYENEFP